MAKKVFIIHGWEGTPDSNWFPWLKKELESRGYEVAVPQMPNTDEPKFSEWFPQLQKIADSPDEETYFIGHSLGCITILRYLESLPEDTKVGGAVLVAGFPDPIGYEEIISFVGQPVDYEKIKKITNNFIAIQSDNDPFVPVKHGETFRDKLGAELIELKGREHFDEFKIPEALEAILKISE
jgi:predicted alpha/beta hydrolase family esterase